MANQPIPIALPAEPVAGALPVAAARSSVVADELARLVEVHAAMMYRVAYALLRHPQDAEDAVQDALLKLYRGGGLAPSPGNDAVRDEKAYLARTVWRAAYDRMQRRVVPVDDPLGEQRLRDTRPTPEQAVAEYDEQALLHHLIDQLPEELRQPLLLSAIQELNSREIAQAIGIPEGTVRTRLMRARQQLRNLYSTSNRTTRPGETAVAER